MKTKVYSFEKLEVWQQSRELIKRIYHFSKFLPKEERYGIVAQIRRASISVSCNLAEGTSRLNPKEQARFSEMAYGSLMEIYSLLVVCTDLDDIPSSRFENLFEMIQGISFNINALRSSQLKRTTPAPPPNLPKSY
ncbi:MAG: four helix bundle protein [Saprospiraceae bacterium]|nr:four helix bundle protein [Saprospiraceae bacterium]